eukprot:ctg_505.g185
MSGFAAGAAGEKRPRSPPDADASVEPPTSNRPPTASTPQQMNSLLQRIHQLSNLLDHRGRIPVQEVLGEDFFRDPPPVYDRRGRRVNTPLQRAWDKLYEERNALLLQAYRLDPHLVLPRGCPPPRAVRRVYFPVREHPHVNFIGLVLGPRGLTQKRIEQRYRCRLVIRGQGARSRDAGDDALHAVIEATGPHAEQNVDACARHLTEELLVPRCDEENELKVAQLRELASMNGTLRDDAKIARALERKHQLEAIQKRRRVDTAQEDAGMTQAATASAPFEEELDSFLNEIEQEEVEEGDRAPRAIGSDEAHAATERRGKNNGFMERDASTGEETPHTARNRRDADVRPGPIPSATLLSAPIETSHPPPLPVPSRTLLPPPRHAAVDEPPPPPPPRRFSGSPRQPPSETRSSKA